MDRTALYRAYNGDGVLLYLGISSCAFRRLSQHLATSQWRYELASVNVQWFEGRAEAEAAEVQAIHAEHPLFNLTFNKGRGIAFKPTPEHLDDHEDDELEAMMWEDVEQYGWSGLVDRAIAAGKMEPTPT